jgi:protocatechuate 3,4-dioxygenase beta subunit
VDAETGAGIPGVEIHALYWTTREIERNDGLRTDAEGLCEVPLPERPAMRLDLGILAPGYAQKFFSWWPSRFGPLPATYTFKVERGTGIGGRVQDEQGKPVENAQIILQFPGVGESSAREPERERFGFWGALPVARTDAAGRWQCANVPPGYSDFGIEVVHDSLPTMTFWVRHDDSSSRGDLELAALYAGNAVLKLQPGYRVAGMVTDEQNRPIAGAKICASYWVNPKSPNAVTGSDGRFEVRNLRKARHAIVVVADGFAPEKVEANLEEGRAEPLAVRLKPGHLLRIRVIDPSGAPVEGADVALESWEVKTNLNCASRPMLAGFSNGDRRRPATLEICVLKPGYGISRNNRLEADGSEHVITIKPEFRVTGRVTDAETGGGIPSFKAVPGYGSQRWDYGDVAYGRDGLYELRFREQRTPYFVRIMAEGYEIAEAGPFDDQGSPREFDFELRRSSLKSVARGVVLNPDGSRPFTCKSPCARSSEE